MILLLSVFTLTLKTELNILVYDNYGRWGGWMWSKTPGAREEKEVFLTVWRVTLRSSIEPRHGITTRSPSRTNTISYSFSDGTNGTLGSENIAQVSDARQRATLALRIIHPLRWTSLQCDQQSANRTLANVARSATSRWNHFYSFQCYNSHVIVTLKEHLPHILLFFAFVSIDRSLAFDVATSVSFGVSNLTGL